MFKFGYKLVRDRIPEIIKEHGEVPVIAFTTQKDRMKALKAKLVEEAIEVQRTFNTGLTDELADVMEVILSIASEANITRQQIEAARKKKRRERGGFKKGILLKC
jgi:predicted house-cleaning noncanonical NTP pyrophosphatase (MazG superfamily)